MTVASARRSGGPTADWGAADSPPVVAVYDVLGVRVGIRADDGSAVELIDRSYGGFRRSGSRASRWLSLRADGAAGWLVTGGDAAPALFPAHGPATMELLHRLVVGVMAGLRDRGLYAVHAGAVARAGRALIVAGPGGTGKTTMTLALAARGFEILSDELAVLDPVAGAILPYRRNVHVRPGTPELVDGLASLADRPREQLGGGIAWAIPHAELGSLPDAEPRPLAGVVLLEPWAETALPAVAPVRSSLAAVELLRGTWAASVDFRTSLAAVADAIHGVPCVRLSPSDPMRSADLVAAWFEASHD